MNYKKRFLSVIGMIMLLMGAIAVLPSTLGVTAQSQTDAIPIIIDTDMGMDDWMAILYLLQRTDVEVLAVTVIGTGLAHCEPGVRNTMSLLALAENPSIPVACGRDTPLQGDYGFPPMWRDAYDVMFELTLPENLNTPPNQSAVELLQQTIEQSEQPVRLVVLGPFTNIAELLNTAPEVGNHIEMMYVMGGALEVSGNLQGGMDTDNTTAEWNIYVDAFATEQVIESGIPITFIPLDATNETPLTRTFYNTLRDDLASPQAEFVYQVISVVINSGNWYFWDQLAAVSATDENVVTIEDRMVSIITDEGNEYGRIILDEGGSLVRVAIHADPAYFEQVYLDVLNGRVP